MQVSKQNICWDPNKMDPKVWRHVSKSKLYEQRAFRIKWPWRVARSHGGSVKRTQSYWLLGTFFKWKETIVFHNKVNIRKKRTCNRRPKIGSVLLDIWGFKKTLLFIIRVKKSAVWKVMKSVGWSSNSQALLEEVVTTVVTQTELRDSWDHGDDKKRNFRSVSLKEEEED